MYTMTPFNGMQNPFLVIRTVFLGQSMMVEQVWWLILQ